MSIKMCFWVEVFMYFVLHNYYDMNIIFFVFIDLERMVFAIPQLSPKCIGVIDQTGKSSFGLFVSKLIF